MRHQIFGAGIAAIILVLSGLSASAQLVTGRSSTEPVEIRGQVRYAGGNSPAVDVLVQLESLNGGYVGQERTDRLGKFRFSGLLPQQYFVELRHPGFQGIRREVNLVMVAAEYLQIALIPDDLARGNSATVFSPKIIDANVPPEARKEFEKAQVAFVNNKKPEEGILHLEKAIQFYPKFVEAQLQLGTAYMDKQQWDKAEDVLKSALANDPKVVNVYFALGALYLQQKRFDEAERSLVKGLEMENRSWQGHYTLGRVYWTRNDSGDLMKAGRQVALALQLNDDFADAHLLAGNIFLRAKMRNEAVEEFEKYLRLAPKGEFATQTRETVAKIKKAQSQ